MTIEDVEQMRFPDTIFALSSGGLPAGVAVVRVSGDATREALALISGRLPEPRVATLRTIRDAEGQVIDQALVLFFPSPRSETGEDMAELHLHGGKAVVAATLRVLSDIEGCRHAEAGEFARRAFLNGKLDLVQVEALGDLVAAETESQRRLAIANAAGAQSRLYESWRKRIVEMLALIEAELDFADEADIPGAVSDSVWPGAAGLADEIDAHVDRAKSTEIVREGYQVVILGPPNAGKSSLLNALAARDVAIVSEEPGTTRDLIEVSLDVDGNKVVVTDTAGVRAAGGVEAIGVARGLERARRADLVISLLPAGDGSDFVEPPEGVEALRVRTKVDLEPVWAGWPGISTANGAGLDVLLDEIGRRARAAGGGSDAYGPTRLRQVEILRMVSDDLRGGANSVDGLELRAEHLRLAALGLGRLTGRIDVEDVLDVVFGQFCVGK